MIKSRRIGIKLIKFNLNCLKRIAIKFLLYCESPKSIFTNVICVKSENSITLTLSTFTLASPIGMPGEKIPSFPDA